MSTDKYDRQTRLWGEGQYLISTATILALGIDCTSLEILKNLVLSGVGHITLVDSKQIDNEDIKENFFLTASDLGKNIAEVSLEAILELNPDCSGTFKNRSIIEFLNETGLEELSKYDLIISANNPNSVNIRLSKICKDSNLRLAITTNWGLINYIRLFENNHAGLQLRLTDRPVIDLRIPCMWQELADYCDSFDLNNQDQINHANTPYVVLLHHALKSYKASHEGKGPKSGKEKNEFKEILKSMAIDEEEANYKEAINFSYFGSDEYKQTITPVFSELFSRLDNESLVVLLSKSNNIMKAFYIVAKAFLMFYEVHKTMPVVGALSDMTSETKYFVSLKKIYENKAKLDKKVLEKNIDNALDLVYADLNEVKDVVKKTIFNNNFNVLELVCKNWPQITLFEYTEFETELPNLTEIDAYEKNDSTNLLWYLMLKTSEQFFEKHGYYPGCTKGNKVSEDFNFLSDSDLFKAELNQYLTNPKNIEHNQYVPSVSHIPEVTIKEFLRNSRVKLIPAVSIIGSIASQEIIKLLSYSFETVNNTVIFDGINVSISRFEMKP